MQKKKKKKKEKITFTVVQIKFLAIHITNQKLLFYIFTVGNLPNILMERDLTPNVFWHKIKIYNFGPCNVFLAIATNIRQLLKTGFVFPGSHIFFHHVLICFQSLFEQFHDLYMYILNIYMKQFYKFSKR